MTADGFTCVSTSVRAAADNLKWKWHLSVGLLLAFVWRRCQPIDEGNSPSGRRPARATQIFGGREDWTAQGRKGEGAVRGEWR